LESSLVRPSRRTFEAADAASADVLSADFACVRALAAAVFDAEPVDGLRSTREAAFAADGLVEGDRFILVSSPSVPLLECRVPTSILMPTAVERSEVIPTAASRV